MDRNKTELTHKVTEAAIRYLDERGFKPVETEVGVARGWVADVAGVCVATETEAIGLKLLPRKPRCPYGVVFGERFDRWATEIKGWEANFEALPSPLTAVVEAKTSVKDFRKDRKWKAAPVADLRYLALPSNLIPANEWPSGWGILLVGNERVTLRQVPVLEPVSIEQRLNVVLEVAMRRDNITRHARLREIQKESRVVFNQKESRVRWSKAMRAVVTIIRGGKDVAWGSRISHATVEDVLKWFNIGVVPRDVLDELSELWGTGEKRPDEIDVAEIGGAAGLHASTGDRLNLHLE